MAAHDDEHDEPAPASQKKVEAFLGSLRQSAQIAQDLLRTTTQQEARIRSLEGELASARARVTFLEGETEHLRERLTSGVPDPARVEQLEGLMEEQNILAQLLVITDRLGRVQSAREVLQVATEVFHNLIGAKRYGIYVADEAGKPVLIAPHDERERRAIDELGELVVQAIATGKESRREGAEDDSVPAAYPLRLGRTTVGAILVVELVPHMGAALDRLQQDLLRLLQDRLVDSMCLGALHHQSSRSDFWPGVRAGLPPVDGKEPR